MTYHSWLKGYQIFWIFRYTRYFVFVASFTSVEIIPFHTVKNFCKMIVLDNLNCEEKEAVKEFQRRMKKFLPSTNYYHDSSICHTFLKARDFNQDKAQKMLRKHIIWRKINQIDTIHEDLKPKEIYLKYLQPSLIGLDKEGDMVSYLPLGKIDSGDTFRSLKCSDLVRHIAYSIENMAKKACISAQGVLLLDLDELTFSDVTCKTSIDFIICLLRITQDNYPERIKHLIAINAPRYSVIMISLTKSVIASSTLRKISVFGRDGWKERLLELVDPDVLPAFLGGNRTDPDGNPLCNTFMIHGGTISPKYFLTDEERYFKDKSQVKMVVIPPKEKREIYVDVTKNGCQIHWRFLVKGKDIKFGLFLEISEHHVEEILPEEKYSTPDGTEEGSCKCQSIGKYIVIFDNSYSWMSTKEVEYCVTVKTMDE